MLKELLSTLSSFSRRAQTCEPPDDIPQDLRLRILMQYPKFFSATEQQWLAKDFWTHLYRSLMELHPTDGQWQHVGETGERVWNFALTCDVVELSFKALAKVYGQRVDEVDEYREW